ncbi:MAG: hypothetical protein WBL28_07995 [Methylotenera sp.]
MAEQKTATQQLEEFRAALADMQAKLPALEEQAAKESSAQKTENLEVPPTMVPESVRTQSVSNGTIDEDAEHKKFLKHLAELPKEQRDAEINKAANPAIMGKQVAEAVAKNLNLELDELNKIQPFDKVVGGFIQNNVSTTSKFSPDGYAGQSSTVQQNLPILPEGIGALFANTTINQDKNLNVTGGNFGLNYASPVKKWGDLDIVGIANVDLNFPAEDSFGGKNVSGLVGTVIKPHEGTDRANYTLAALLNGQGNVGALGRVSKQLYQDGNWEATGYAQVDYNITNNLLNPGGGLRLDYDLGNGNSIYSNTFLGANDALNKPELTWVEQGGFAWGGAEKKSETEKNFVNAIQPSKPSNLVASNDTQENYTVTRYQPLGEGGGRELHSQKPEIMNTYAPHAASTTSYEPDAGDPMLAASNKFYSLHGSKQEQFVDRLAHNVARNTGMDAAAAKDYLIERFADYQNQHEQVAQR